MARERERERERECTCFNLAVNKERNKELENANDE